MNIETNDRFDKLTNLDISTHYREREYCLMKSNFLGAFAYWAVSQSPYETPGISDSLLAFSDYIGRFIRNPDVPEAFTYDELTEIISEEEFEKLPHVLALNVPKIDSGLKFASSSRFHKTKADYDYIDLGALARNIRYMLMRETITSGL